MPVPPGGTSPASAYLPNPHVPSQEPPVILADLIDPATGDYASLIDSAEPTDAAVQLTFTVERNTGAVARNHGHSFRTLRHQDELDEATALSLAEEAVRHLLDAGDVRLTGVVLEPRDTGRDDHAVAGIRFRNLRTGQDLEQRIPGL